MKQIEFALKDVRKVLIISGLFNTTLNALIIFLGFVLIFILGDLKFYYAIAPAVVYFLFSTYKNFKRNSYKEVEERFPDLEWQLRTSADNLDKENEVVESLHKSVLRKIENVRVSSFFSNKATVFKLLSATALSFLIMFMATFDVNVFDLNKITGDFLKLDNKDELEGLDYENYEGEFEKESNREIYGDEKIVELGNKNIEIELNPEEGEINPDEIREVEEKEFERGKLGDIGVSSDRSHEERIKREYQELIKQYFSRLTEQ